MKALRLTFWSPTERIIACIFLVECLPVMLLIALFIVQTAGKPIFIADPLPSSANPLARFRYRFRTTGPGAALFHTVGRFLRQWSLDELPGLWNVLRGDLRLRDLLSSR